MSNLFREEVLDEPGVSDKRKQTTFKILGAVTYYLGTGNLTSEFAEPCTKCSTYCMFKEAYLLLNR